MLSRTTAALVALTLFGGCGNQEPEVKDLVAPTLEITAPPRGTYTAGGTIEVRGVASDDVGIDSVTVNGVAAEVDAAGRFKVSVPLEPGIVVLETVATDAGGNQVTDTRATLAGELAPPGTRIDNGLVAEISPQTLSVLGDLVGYFASGVDLTSLVSAANPVLKKGGSCLGVSVDVQSIRYGDIDVSLSPASGAIETVVRITDLDVDMKAHYKVACIGASSGVHLSADSLELRGDVGLALENGAIAVDLPGVDASFTGFALQVGAIPSSIVDLIVSDIDQRVANAIEGPVGDMVPGTLSGLLADFSENAISTEILGTAIDIGVRPTNLELGADGGKIALELVSSAPEIQGAVYPSSPAPSPLMGTMGSQAGGLGVALADDAVNQLLALLWHARALEQSVDVGEGSPLAGIVDGADRFDFSMLLPPVISANAENGRARIGIGDLVIDAAAGDKVLAKLALSGHIDVAVTINDSGAPSLVADLADLSVMVLENDGSLGLGPDQIEAFAGAGIATLRGRLNKSLSRLTIPQFGAEVRSASLETTIGYLLVAGQLGAAGD